MEYFMFSMYLVHFNFGLCLHILYVVILIFDFDISLLKLNIWIVITGHFDFRYVAI